MNPRKLVAIDIVFLGSIFIIAEFASGVVLCVALGIFVLVRGNSFWQLALGLYIISLGINYVPMLIYALVITKYKSACTELGDELIDQRRAMASIGASPYCYWCHFWCHSSRSVTSTAGHQVSFVEIPTPE